ncbi:hypothetical protein ACMFMG_000488 [Clarireedia jacksonii]
MKEMQTFEDLRSKIGRKCSGAAEKNAIGGFGRDAGFEKTVERAFKTVAADSDQPDGTVWSMDENGDKDTGFYHELKTDLAETGYTETYLAKNDMGPIIEEFVEYLGRNNYLDEP